MQNAIVSAIIGVIVGVGIGFAFSNSSPLGSSYAELKTRRVSDIVINEVTTTTPGSFRDVSTYKNVVFAVHGTSATATVKFIGSVQSTAPNTASASSSTNSYEYLSFTDLQSNASTIGDTGLLFTGTSDTRYIQVNTDLIKWITPVVTSYTTGTISVIQLIGDNQ